MGRLTAPYTAFGKTKDVPIEVHLNGHVVESSVWDSTLWVERPEDCYAMMSPQLKGKKVRIIRREVWLNSESIYEPPIINIKPTV